MEFFLKSKFPKYSKKSPNNTSKRKKTIAISNIKQKFTFDMLVTIKKKKLMKIYLPSVSVFLVGLILLKSLTNEQSYPPIICLSFSSETKITGIFWSDKQENTIVFNKIQMTEFNECYHIK